MTLVRNLHILRQMEKEQSQGVISYMRPSFSRNLTIEDLGVQMQSRHPHPWFLMNILIYLLMYVRMVNSHLRDLGLTDPSLRWRGKTHKNPFKTETHVKGINILRLLISWVSPNRTFNSLVCVYSTSLVTILIIDHGLLIPSLMLVYRFPFFSSL